MTESPELQEVIKKYDLGYASEERYRLQRIPWGIRRLDNFIGGGVPRGRISVVSGQSSSGKSFLVCKFIEHAQKNGLTAAYYDAEKAMDAAWFEQCGVDLESLIFSQESVGERIIDAAIALLDAHIDILVVDSVPAVISADEFEAQTEWNPSALRARFWSMAIPRLIAHTKSTATILINQERSGIGMRGDPTVLPGGVAHRFFSSVVLRTRKGAWIEQDKKVLGHEIVIRHWKTKVGGDEYGNVTIPFLKSGDVDHLEMLMSDAKSTDNDAVIRQSGAFYYWKGELDEQGEPWKMRGWQNVVDHFRENDADREKLLSHVEAAT